MSDPKKEDVLDLYRADRVKLDAELAAAREEIAAMKKAAVAAPPAPAPAPAAPAPAPAPPLRDPTSPKDLVENFTFAEQEALNEAFQKAHGTKERLFDHLYRTFYGGRVTISDPGTYVPGEFVLRPSNTTPAPAATGRKSPVSTTGKR